MKNTPLWSNDGFDIDNGYMWFVPFEMNILCKYNIFERVIEEYYILEDYECGEGAVYNVAVWGNSTITIPARSKNMCIINSGVKREYKVSKEGQAKEKYSCSVKTKNALYIFPINEQYVIKWYSDQFEKIKFVHGPVISCGLVENEIYFTNTENILYRTDESFDNILAVDVADITDVYNVSIFGNIILLLTLEGKVVRLNPGERSITDEIVRLNKDDYWSNCVYINEKIVLFPYKDCTKIWIYDCDIKTMKFISVEKDEYFNDGWRYNSFGHPTEINGNIYVMSPRHRAFFVINPDEGIIDRHHIFLKIGKEDSLMMLKKKFDLHAVVYENQYHSINTLLDCIK